MLFLQTLEMYECYFLDTVSISFPYSLQQSRENNFSLVNRVLAAAHD